MNDKRKPGKIPSKPTSAGETAGTRIKETKVEPRRWAFSFRFWRQLENYGCSREQPKWFIALLDRLKDVSEMVIEELEFDFAKKKKLRMHPVEFGRPSVTIKREDLNWIEKKYLESPEDYEFVQFHVGKAFGRVMGFMDENQIFNIVLLDPQHNIYLCSDNNFLIQPCDVLESPYAALLAEHDAIHTGLRCQERDCGAKLAAAKNNLMAHPNGVMVFLKEDDLGLLRDAVRDGRVGSLGELLLESLMSKLEDSK